MRITVIDGQGGKIGRQLVELIISVYPQVILTAVGTNSIATTTMIKGGVKFAATGENAVIVACRKSDIIIGPVGIVIADSLLGEITPSMSVAIGQSSAVKILIPINKCENIIVGVDDTSVTALLEDVMKKISKIISDPEEIIK